MKRLFAALGISLLVVVSAGAAPLKTVKTAGGNVLAGENGMTLYTFKKDAPGVSNCYDECAVNWPPAIATGDAMAEGDMTLVERKDGARQWAKGGMPLYFWIKDKKEGDTTGDGVGGNWDVARP